MGYREWPVRRQLLASYGCTVAVTFTVMIAICAAGVYSLRDLVIDTSREQLRERVQKNNAVLASEASDVFVAILDIGLKGLVLTPVYAMYDVFDSAKQYSIIPPSISYSQHDIPNPIKDPSGRYATSSISHDVSEVSITTMQVDGRDAKQLMEQRKDLVQKSAHMDSFVSAVWQREACFDWLNSFLGFEGSPAVVRKYPGTTTGYCPDFCADGIVTYDPAIRGWYKEAKTKGRTQPFSYEAVYTPAYLDASGNGMLLSITVPMYTPQGKLIGAGLTDLRVKNVLNLVQQIKPLQSGQAHIFHTKAKTVVASPSWPATGTSDPPRIGSLRMLSGDHDYTFDPVEDQIASGSGSFVHEDEVEVLHHQILGGTYTLVICTLLEEVYKSISEQEGTIKDGANELFTSALIVCIVSLVLIIGSVVLLALHLSKPLIRTAEESSQITNNLGGDLFEGVEVKGQMGGVGEVHELRSSYLALIHDLQAKRNIRPAARKPNPLAGHAALANFIGSGKGTKELDPKLAKIQLHAQATEAIGSDIPNDDSETRKFLKAETRWYQHVFCHLVAKLIVPMIIALTIVMAVTGSWMAEKGPQWAEPIREAMIREEKKTLKTRAFQKSELISKTLNAHQNTLMMAKDYAEKLLSDELQRGDPYKQYFAPRERCPAWESPENCEDLPQTIEQHREDKRKANLDHSIWYSPQEQRPTGRTGFWTAPGASDVDRLQKLTKEYIPHLLNVFRVAYFSSELDYIYMGFEQEETYTMYPAQDMRPYDRMRLKCEEATEGTLKDIETRGYTPICRTWYHNAWRKFEEGQQLGREEGEGVVFNPMYRGAGTNNICMSLSTPVVVEGRFAGVMSIDVDVNVLQKALLQTKIMQNGYLYMIDDEGNGVVHPKASLGMVEKISTIEGDLGENSQIINEYNKKVLPGVLAVSEEPGILEWEKPPGGNDDSDEPATWYVTYARVKGTPFTVVLTVPKTDVTAAADEIVDNITSKLAEHLGITISISLVAAAALVVFSMLYNKRFSVPIHQLAMLMAHAQQQNYTDDVNPSLAKRASGAELLQIMTNFHNLLVALRFGNQAYYRGSRAKEMENYQDALKIIEATANGRGRGVCYNNIGNCASAMLKAKMQVPVQPEKAFEEAIDNARQQLQAVSDEGARAQLQDTLALRLLNRALWRFGCGDDHLRNQAETDISQAVETCQNPGVLAQIAMHVARASDHAGARSAALAAGDKCLTVCGSMENMAAEVQVACLTDLCSAMAILKGSAWACWALQKLQRLPATSLGMLALLAKDSGDDSVINAVDDAIRPISGELGIKKWKPGPLDEGGPMQAFQMLGFGKSNPKCVVFCLDRTWTPILDVLIDSTKMVFSDHLADDDSVGLYGLGDGWLFRVSKRDPDMLSKIEAARQSKGQCVLYESMSDCLGELLKQPEGTDLWLVVLTDLVDLQGGKGEEMKKQVISAMKRMKSLNVAVIDSSAISHYDPENKSWPRWRQNVNDFMGALEESGNKGYHLNASDEAEVASAFQQVASLMSAGVQEFL